ncbi:unnamed protein product, partial [Choristocarpus tenellus]
LSAYLFFSIANRKDILRKLPPEQLAGKQTIVLKMCAKLWAQRTEAEDRKYKELWMRDKARYDREMVEFKKAQDEGRVWMPKSSDQLAEAEALVEQEIDSSNSESGGNSDDYDIDDGMEEEDMEMDNHADGDITRGLGGESEGQNEPKQAVSRLSTKASEAQPEFKDKEHKLPKVSAVAAQEAAGNEGLRTEEKLASGEMDGTNNFLSGGGVLIGRERGTKVKDRIGTVTGRQEGMGQEGVPVTAATVSGGSRGGDLGNVAATIGHLGLEVE